MIGICKLCGDARPLVKSHIIPRSFIHEIKGDSKEIYAVMGRDRKPVEFHQSGIFSNNIVCGNCEKKFCPADTYGFKVFGVPPGNNNPIEHEEDVAPFILQNIDYPKLKLFILQILWRAAVSKHQFFDGLNLGPHEKKIGTMILTQNPGSFEDYSVIVFRMVGQKHERAIYPPWRLKMDGVNFNIIYLPSLRIYIKTDQRPVPPPLRIAVLQSRTENIAIPSKLHGSENFFLKEARRTLQRWNASRASKR